MKSPIALLVVFSLGCLSLHSQILQGIVGGAAPAASEPNTARSFNGSTQNLTNSICYLSGASAFTVAFWFKSGSITQTNAYAMNVTTGSGDIFGILYGYVNDGSGHAQLEFYAPGYGGTDPRVGSQITIVDTNWHHVAYRAGSSTWDFFLDGAKTIINTDGVVLPSKTGCTLTVASAETGNWTNAAAARLYISTSALSDAQIIAMTGTTCSTTGVAGTIGYWRLLGADSPEPEIAPSGNTNSLTLVGAPAQVAGPTCSSH